MAAPQIDGLVTNHGVGAGSLSVSLTTAYANDIIVVDIFTGTNSGGTPVVSSVTSTGLTFVRRSQSRASGRGCMEVWWALAAAAGTRTITATLSFAPDNTTVVAFGVNGCGNLSAPWDVNASLPVTRSENSNSTVAMTFTPVSTTATETMLLFGHGIALAFSPNPMNTPVISGFTALTTVSGTGGSLPAYAEYQYKALTAVLTSGSYSSNVNGQNFSGEGFMDAIVGGGTLGVPGGGAAPPVMTFMLG